MKSKSNTVKKLKQVEAFIATVQLARKQDSKMIDHFAGLIKGNIRRTKELCKSRGSLSLKNAIEYMHNTPIPHSVIIAAFMKAGFDCTFMGSGYFFNVNQRDLDRLWPPVDPNVIRWRIRHQGGDENQWLGKHVKRFC